MISGVYISFPYLCFRFSLEDRLQSCRIKGGKRFLRMGVPFRGVFLFEREDQYTITCHDLEIAM